MVCFCFWYQDAWSNHKHSKHYYLYDRILQLSDVMLNALNRSGRILEQSCGAIWDYSQITKHSVKGRLFFSTSQFLAFNATGFLCFTYFCWILWQLRKQLMMKTRRYKLHNCCRDHQNTVFFLYSLMLPCRDRDSLFHYELIFQSI